MTHKRSGRRKWVRRWGLLLLTPVVALLTAVGMLAFDGETGLPALRELLRRVAGAEQRVRNLDAERHELIEHVRALRTDPFVIESEARGTLGMVRPEEIVILLEGEDGVAQR